MENNNNILEYIKNILEFSSSKKRLIVLPGDPIRAYEFKGQSNVLQDYYNPKKFFDVVFCLSPLEDGIKYQYGMHIIGVNDDIFRESIKIIHPDAIRCYSEGPLPFAYRNRIDKSIPLIASIHARGTTEKILMADYVFCVTETCAEDVRKYLPSSKVFVFSDRVNRQVFFPKHKKYLRTAHKNILCVGRRHPSKNIETVIEALSLLPSTYRLTQIGAGQVDELKALAKKLGVADRCTFLDRCENTELPNYYRNFDCFCLPTLTEGFGIVFIEAASCGCPIVGPNIEPINTYLKHKETAYLVDDLKNSKEVANAIEYMCSEQGKIITENAIKATQKFDSGLVEKMEADLYAKICQLSQKTLLKKMISKMSLPTLKKRF